MNLWNSPVATKVILSTLTFASFISCKTNKNQISETLAASSSVEQVPLCAAIRGNGELIFGQFGAMAKITETFGVVGGIAGGSSGSLSSFVYESMYQSKFLERDRITDRDPESAQRLSLMLKSMLGYMEVLEETQFYQDVMGIMAAVNKVQEAANDSVFKVGELFVRDLFGKRTGIKTLKQLNRIVNSRFLKDMFNKNLVAFIRKSHKAHEGKSIFSMANLGVVNPKEYFENIRIAFTTFGSFDGDDPRVFFREGAVNFAELASRFGRIANFYAGYGPLDPNSNMNPQYYSYRDNMSQFVNSCSKPAWGKSWAEIKNIKATNGKRCGELYSSALKTYRAMLKSRDGELDKYFKLRINDNVGDMGPKNFLAIGITSFIKSGSPLESRYEDALESLRRSGAGAEEIQFNVELNRNDFVEDVKFGYWSSSNYINQLKKPSQFNGLKVKKRHIFETSTWKDVLLVSPAEPGLAIAMGFKNAGKLRYSTGGWGDLHPVQILRDAKCKKIIFVTRRGQETKFGRKVARHLGMTKPLEKQLFELGPNSSSSFDSALKDADVVWCTNWDSFIIGKTDNFIETVFNDGYAAPFEIRKKSGNQRLIATGRRSTQYKPQGVGFTGCTPGIAPTVN